MRSHTDFSQNVELHQRVENKIIFSWTSSKLYSSLHTALLGVGLGGKCCGSLDVLK